MAETHGTSDDPLAVYDELRLAGQAPDVQDFCARFPDHPSLADRIAALHRLQHDLRRLAEPRPSPEAHVAPAGFTLLATLGAGGMGSVYLALQHSPRRLCALKFVHHATPNAYARFAREADLAARLIDPGIAAVFAFGNAGGRAYLACEYVHGFSLRSLLATADLVAPQSGVTWLVEALRHLSAGSTPGGRASSPAPAAVMVDLARQVAEALGCAHAHAVVHRDVKPSNVMVAFDGTAKLIDFGLAVSADETHGRVTATGAFLGSYDYAAPEQLRGDAAAIGAWTDTYALGATLFEMLSLRTPFECANFADRLALAGALPPQGPRAFNPDVPPALDHLVRKALDPAPERRFQDGQEMAEALRDSPRGAFAFLPRGWSSRVHVSGTAWVALLAAAGAITFAALWANERADHEVSARDHEQHARDAAQHVLGWRLEQRRAALEQCLPPEAVTERVPARSTPPKPPAHLWATIVVHAGRVEAVRPHAHAGLTGDTRACLMAALADMDLPGVGLNEPLTLVVDLRVRPQAGP